MGGMEFNKIFAAILIAGIIAMFGGFVSKALVHPKHMEQNAFNIEAAADDGAGGGPAKVAGPEPIQGLIAAADVAKGEKIAKACAACHSFTKGGPNGVGPNLWGVVGGPKHHMAGFAYSGALIEAGGKTWTYAEMNKFLWKPKAYAPATKMSFAGVKKAEDRAALLAWLRTQADSPAALPSDADIAAETAALAPPAPAAEAPAADAAAAPADAKATGAAPAEAAPAAAKH
jgi:cytochrome c